MGRPSLCSRVARLLAGLANMACCHMRRHGIRPGVGVFAAVGLECRRWGRTVARDVTWIFAYVAIAVVS